MEPVYIFDIPDKIQRALKEKFGCEAEFIVEEYRGLYAWLYNGSCVLLSNKSKYKNEV